jgi:EAL and modified HD-GYP domain-containing signal transduction protein
MKEMIERMGKNALMQWLLLIIYSKSGISATGRINHYTLLTQKRVDLILKLISLASQNPSEKLVENGRLIALYSLLEEFMNLPIEEIVRALNPNSEIKDALLVHAGLLGRVYTAALKLENNDLITASLLLKPYGVGVEALESIW